MERAHKFGFFISRYWGLDKRCYLSIITGCVDILAYNNSVNYTYRPSFIAYTKVSSTLKKIYILIEDLNHLTTNKQSSYVNYSYTFFLPLIKDLSLMLSIIYSTYLITTPRFTPYLDIQFIQSIWDKLFYALTIGPFPHL